MTPTTGEDKGFVKMYSKRRVSLGMGLILYIMFVSSRLSTTTVWKHDMCLLSNCIPPASLDPVNLRCPTVVEKQRLSRKANRVPICYQL